MNIGAKNLELIDESVDKENEENKNEERNSDGV